MKKFLYLICLLTFSVSADQRLTDKYGKTIGTIQDHPDGKQILKDKYGRVVGSYSPNGFKNGATYDQYGRMIGSGNQLLQTLPKDKK